LFGGWQTTFTVGYGLPLKDFVFYSDGKRFLNITFGSPLEEILIEKLIVKVRVNVHRTNKLYFISLSLHGIICRLCGHYVFGIHYKLPSLFLL
jgi:hypothetical protein